MVTGSYLVFMDHVPQYDARCEKDDDDYHHHGQDITGHFYHAVSPLR
jgi:hypothetical protein